MAASCLLLILAVWTSWLPPDLVPATPMVIATVCLALTPWGLRRSAAHSTAGWLLAAALLLTMVVLGSASGWDRARAVQELALLLAIAVVAWLASRQSPPRQLPTLLALAVSLLACWALWQVSIGFTAMGRLIPELPAELRDAYAHRLAVGRAFASLPLPGHLAILLATALPLLLPGSRPRELPASEHVGSSSMTIPLWLRWSGCLLCALGIVLSRSLLGAGLACCACMVVMVQRYGHQGATGRRRARLILAMALMVIAAIGLVMALRSDLSELEPVRLRLDNWRTALWVWSGSPLTGVGLGGFGQASQAVPFPVGNRPIHAHSLPLEVLAELGPVGLGLLAVLGMLLLRLLRTLWPRQPALAVAVSLVPLHNLVDFSLFVIGVAVPWAVLLGWAVAQSADPTGQRTPEEQVPDSAFDRPLVRWASTVVAVLALLGATAQTASTILERSAAAAPTTSQLSIELAGTLAPWRIGPVELQVLTALQARREQSLDKARHALRRGRWLRPHSAHLASLESRLALARGEIAGALASAWSACESQPYSSDHAEHLKELLDWVEPGG